MPPARRPRRGIRATQAFVASKSLVAGLRDNRLGSGRRWTRRTERRPRSATPTTTARASQRSSRSASRAGPGCRRPAMSSWAQRPGGTFQVHAAFEPESCPRPARYSYSVLSTWYLYLPFNFGRYTGLVPSTGASADERSSPPRGARSAMPFFLLSAHLLGGFLVVVPPPKPCLVVELHRVLRGVADRRSSRPGRAR